MAFTRLLIEDEYSKNEDLKRDEVKELMSWMLTQPDLPIVSEYQVARFHHSCYYIIENTKKCIKEYYHIRLNNPKFFSGRDVCLENLKEQLNVVQFAMLPVKDPNGYQIIFHRLQDFEPSKYIFQDSVKILCMATDASLQTQPLLPGFIMLFDMNGVRFGHLLRVSVSNLKKFFRYIQEAMPVRLKAIHVVNTVPIIDKIMFMIRPFMKRELVKLLHFHSSDYEEVQKFLPKTCLPSDFGGDLQSCAELHEDFKKEMLELRNEFLEEEQYLKSQLNKDLRKSLTELSEQSSFEKLNID